MLQQILDKYANWPGGQALLVISRQNSGRAIKEILRLAGIDSPRVQGALQRHCQARDHPAQVAGCFDPYGPPYLRRAAGQDEGRPADYA